MELTNRHLHVLCTIEEEGSLGKAAARLGMSQPALTAQLQRIEVELQEQIFERSRSGTQPTSAGRKVLTEAHAALSAFERLREGARGLEAGDKTVRLGGYGPLLVNLVEKLTSELGQGVPFTIRSERSARVLQAELEQGKIDFAIVTELVGHERPRPRGITEWLLNEREPIFVGLSRTHRLAGRDEIHLAELADDNWAIEAHDDTGEDQLLAKACRDAGFEQRIGLITDDNGVARSFVGRGHAVSLFSARASEDHELVVRPIANSPLNLRLALRWRRNEQTAANSEQVCASLRAVYDEACDSHPVFSQWRARHAAEVT